MLGFVGKMAGKREMDREAYIRKFCSERLYSQFGHLHPTHTQWGSQSNPQRLIGSVKQMGGVIFSCEGCLVQRLPAGAV